MAKFPTAPEKPHLSTEVVFLEVEDESMWAAASAQSFAKGDHILISPTTKVRSGSLVIAHRAGDDRSMFRRLRIRRDGKRQVRELEPLNPDYETVRLDGAMPGRILAKVVRHVRKVG